MVRLPSSHRILPASIDFAIPGFEHEIIPGVKTLAPTSLDCEQWFADFVELVRSAIGVRYLPICRISDGEFRFLLGDQPRGPVWPWTSRIAGWCRTHLFRRSPHGVFSAGGVERGKQIYSSGSYTRVEWIAARDSYSKHLVEIANEGVLAVHLTHDTPRPFQQHYFPAFGQWLTSNHIELSARNYVPFYFAYALLRGASREKILSRKRILVVHSAENEKRQKIVAGLKAEGAAEVCWQTISRNRSLFDKFDVSKWHAKVDLCLVGAGIGKPNILTQLRPLAVPCIDAGYVFEVWANPALAAGRPFMEPRDSTS